MFGHLFQLNESLVNCSLKHQVLRKVAGIKPIEHVSGIERALCGALWIKVDPMHWLLLLLLISKPTGGQFLICDPLLGCCYFGPVDSKIISARLIVFNAAMTFILMMILFPTVKTCDYGICWVLVGLFCVTLILVMIRVITVFTIFLK